MKQHSIDHYASVVAVLLAGDVQARLVRNSAAPAIETRTPDGDRILWGNTGATWAFTLVQADGSVVGGRTETPSGVPPEQAAVLISKGMQA